jgi:hypothetical protein
MFGNKCADCGISITIHNKDYLSHFHHTDPKTKLFIISHGLYRYTLDAVIEEAKKCILLCKDCHRKRHPEIYKCDFDGLNNDNRWRLNMSREERLARLLKRRQLRATPEEREKARKYREEHKEQILQYNRIYHETHKEQKQAWYLANKEEILKKNKERYHKNRDKYAAAQHIYNITRKRELAKLKRDNETPEQRAERLRIKSERSKLSRMNETPEQRAIRLEKKKSWYLNKISKSKET